MSRADQSHRRRKNPLAAVFRAVGIILLIAIIAICVPLIVPKTMGYQLYTVVSGSMEPAVPTGSLVYIKYVEPGDIETGDIIAFYGSDAQGSIITHRVVSNSNAMGEFITKGDANAENDMNPVNYEQYVGKMVRSIPKVGGHCPDDHCRLRKDGAEMCHRAGNCASGSCSSTEPEVRGWRSRGYGLNFLYRKRNKSRCVITLTEKYQCDINNTYMVCY